jgi:rhodanese-related sulfurtransferase
MARLLSLLLALLFPVLVACGSDAPDEGPAADDGEVVRMSASEFEEAAYGPGVVVLDVRTPEEYAEGHLPDAVNLDLSDPGFETALDDLDPESTYAVYCRTGSRSLAAAETMLRAGFEDVFDLEGGIEAWQGEVVR